MTTINKKTFKGLTTGIKVRKPRYYYQDIVETYAEDSVRNIELKKFEGLEYDVNQRVINFKEKVLWNNTISPNIMRVLAPYDNGTRYLASTLLEDGESNVFELKGCLFEDDGYLPLSLSAFCGNGDVLLSTSDNDKNGYAWGGKVYIPSNTSLYKAYKANYNVVGQVSYGSAYEAKGFGSTNYIEIPAMKEYTSYEMVFRGSIPEQTSGHLVWGERQGSSFYIVGANKKLALADTIGKTIIPINTVYDFRLVWDGTKSTIYTRVAVNESEAENPWTLEATRDNDVFRDLTTLRIGGPSKTTSSYWKGYIDLFNSYIKVDGEYYWKPLSEV